MVPLLVDPPGLVPQLHPLRLPAQPIHGSGTALGAAGQVASCRADRVNPSMFGPNMLRPILVLYGLPACVARPPVLAALHGSLQGPVLPPELRHFLPVVRTVQVPEEPGLVGLLGVALGAPVRCCLQWKWL